MFYPNSAVYNLRINGVTLTELLITLAIAAVVTSMAIPTFNTTIARMRITSHTNEFLSYLNYARNEAITRGRRVIICKSADAISCADTGSWEQGLVVFVDNNDDKVLDADEILRVHTKFDSTVTITGDSMVNEYIAYSSDGRTRMDTGASQEGILSICGIRLRSDDLDSRLRSAIKIYKVGRARSNEKCKFCPAPGPECAECTADCL